MGPNLFVIDLYIRKLDVSKETYEREFSLQNFFFIKDNLLWCDRNVSLQICAKKTGQSKCEFNTTWISEDKMTKMK